MARTWTLAATLSTDISVTPKRALVTSGAVYFYGGIGPSLPTATHHKIFKWDGVTLTDIAGASFPVDSGGNTMHLYDICIFNGSLFCIYGRGSNAISDFIYRHTGGTSWTNEHTLVDEGAAPLHAANGVPGNQEAYFSIMDADSSFMAIATTKGATPANWRLVTRNTSGAYAVSTMPDGGVDGPVPQLVGNSKGSGYGSLIGNYDTASANYRPMQIGGPSPWTHLAGSAIGDRRLIGYADGKSFFSVLDGSNWELKYSTDWGVNLVAAGNLEQGGSDRSLFVMKDLADDAIMLTLQTSDGQIYVWDPDTDTFIADGAVDSGLIVYDFFSLNDTLYALCSSATANSVDIWQGGSLACHAQFYYGIGVPVLASELPICGVRPGAMAVAAQSGVVVLGSDGRGGPSVIYQNYLYAGEWVDIGGIVPTGTAVNSVKFL